MSYQFSALSDPGRVRANNEDALAYDVATGLALLADGMGGYNAGEVASEMAISFIKSELSRWLAQAGAQANAREVRRAMEICVENANQAIYRASVEHPPYAGMGTTLVVAVFQTGRLLLGHLGDSRCYRLRASALSQITRDHSLMQEQIDAGLITAAQAQLSPHRNLLTRALGVEGRAVLEVHEFEVEEGDLYLLCSDGLTDMVRDEAMSGLLQLDSPLEQRARALVNLANQNGGRDNVSVLLVQFVASASRRGLISRLLGK